MIFYVKFCVSVHGIYYITSLIIILQPTYVIQERAMCMLCMLPKISV